MDFPRVLVTVYTALRDAAREHYTESLFAAIGSISILAGRYLFFSPAKALFLYLFSEEYRDRWHISGDYYLYHEPIIVEKDARIRLSCLKLTTGIYSSSAEQADWKRSKDVMYKGDVCFSGQFITLRLEGSVERYKGVRKVIILHRIYRLTGTTANTGTSGKMMGIANDNEIYAVPVLLSRRPMSYAAARHILKLASVETKGMVLRNEVREAVEKTTPLTTTFIAERYHSPFS